MTRRRQLYSPTGHSAYHHVGADPAPPAPAPNGSSGAQLLGWAAVGAGAYHGYKRNNSIGWAIGWALLAGFFPIITVPVSLAQGFGKRKGG